MALSPDGRWALALTPDAPAQLVLLPTGPGQPRLVTHDAITHQGAVFFPDGRRVLFQGYEPGKPPGYYVQSLDGGAPQPALPAGARTSFGRPIAPDGRSIAAIDPRERFVLYPVGGGAPEPLPGATSMDTLIGWSQDGRSLFVYRQNEVPARIFRVEIATGRRELWREIAPPDPAGIAGLDPVIVSPDGSTCVYGFRRFLSDLYLVDGLR
jgi:eukaryotic-like serine/threonine-protein kinase